MKLLRHSMPVILLIILLLVLLFGNPGNNLNLMETAKADDNLENKQSKTAGEQFVVAVLPFYYTDDLGKDNIDFKFMESLKKKVEEKFSDLQFLTIENCTEYDEEITMSKVRETEANLLIYGKTEYKNGKLEEITYYIVPLSGFEINPFLIRNREVLEQLSARDTCSIIETEALRVTEVDKKDYSTLLYIVNSLKEYKKLNFESSLKSLQSIKDYENNYQILFYIANCNYFENRLNESLFFYEKVLELEPQTAEAMLNKANTLAFLASTKYIYQGQEGFERNSDLTGQAIETYDKVIELDPQSAIAWTNKGCLLNEIGEQEEALKACEEAIEINPDFELAWRNKGDCLISLGRYYEAIKAYDEALEIDPENPGAWCGKSFSFLAIGEYEESLEACESGLAAHPQYWGLWHNKGNALYFSGRLEEAQEAYNKAVELNPEFTIAWMNKGNIYKELGETDKALEAYDRALSIDPNYSNLWYNKGNLYYTLDNYEEAVSAYNKALEINPENENAWLSKALSLYLLSRYEDSLNATDKVIEINPQNSNAWLNRGDILSEMGRYDESKAAYWKGLKYLFREWIGI